MIIFTIITIIQSSIPHKYDDLVSAALKSAETKIAKTSREDTKYPGYYSSTNYQFKLIKPLTSKYTHDVKGFSFSESNCAIVKRKGFNIPDGFAVVDQHTQNIFLMLKKVASDQKVVVYDSVKISVFHIMTDFILQTSTDETINNVPLKSVIRASKRPKADIKFSHNWKDEVDRPGLQPIFESDIEVGTGFSIKVGASTKISFKSIWDISISFRLSFEGKFGVEIVVPDDCELEIDTITLFEKKIALPSLGFVANFLGLEISVGAFINFALDLDNIKVSIPLGFDYFKGYRITATKYYEITPTSITDSKWETNINELPQIDSTKDVFKSILSSKFSAAIQFRPFISLEFNFGSFGSGLECGLKFPVQFDISFNTELCGYPHLWADLSMPIKMYFAFQGLSFENYDLIDEAEKEISLVTIKLPSFCFGSSRMIKSDKGFDPYSTGMYITMDDAYDERSSSVTPVEKLVTISLLNDQYQLLDERSLVFNLYTTQKTQHDRFYLAYHYEAKNILWSLSYIDSNMDLQYSDDAVLKETTSFTFDDNGKLSLPINLRRSTTDNSDILKMTANIEKVDCFFANEIYIRKTDWILMCFNEVSFSEYCLFCIDKDGNRRIDKGATFISYYAQTEDMKYTGDKYMCDLNEYVIQIIDIDIEKDNVKAKIEILREYNEGDIFTVASIFTPTLNAGDDLTLIPELQSMYPLYCKEDFVFYLFATIYVNGEEKTFPFYFPNPRNEDAPVITYPFTDDDDGSLIASFTFQIFIPATMFLVKTSLAKPYNNYETVTAVCDMYAYVYETVKDEYYYFFFVFNTQETYKILKFENIPEEHRHDKIYIMFRYEEYGISFLDSRVTQFDSGAGIIDIDGCDTLEIPIIREYQDNVEIYGKFHYVKYQPTGMIYVPDGTPFSVRKGIGTFVMVPDYYGSASLLFEFTEGTTGFYIADRYKNYSTFVFYGYHDNGDEFILYLNSTGLAEDEPSVSIDLTNLQNYADTYGQIIYSVYSHNGIKIRAEMNEKSEIVDIVDQKATFIFKGKLNNVVFTSLCSNESEKGCEIKYPEPEETGFHLIRYPDRWGISTTGQGFLAEAIPVEKGKSFYYYKTYIGEIELYRKYSSEAIQITIKIIDNRNGNYENMKRTRKICLLDPNNLIVPFSRKFVNENFFEFLEMIGISKEIDLNYLYNDEDGSIIFDPQYISSNDFSNVSKKACDLNIKDGVFKVDKSEKIFDIGGIDKSQRNKTIILIVVSLLIILLIFIAFIICVVCICRKKCRKNSKKKHHKKKHHNKDKKNKEDSSSSANEDSLSLSEDQSSLNEESIYLSEQSSLKEDTANL